MCVACGIPTHVPDPSEALDAVAVSRFVALRHRDCRNYLFGGMLSMMADNIEHVITYWVLWERFHSAALTGFEVISHWLPFLFLSVYTGGLADRFDCRRVIQAAQVLYMSVSVSWGVLFATGSLHMWNAALLLVVHGTAGALWQPAEQLMLHDFVGPRELPSAVRLNATFRSAGILLGPVVGTVLLLGLKPEAGIFTNAAIYLPLTLWLLRTRYTGHSRDIGVVRERPTFRTAVRTLREVAGEPALISMVVLGGLGSLFIGASLQPIMPQFANFLGVGSAGTAYGVLLFANGLGGVLGGVLLETTPWLRPSVRSATIATIGFGAATAAFAFSHSYVLSLFLLVLVGIGNLASQSIGQTVVQLLAPPEKRGRIVGVYSMSSGGMRAGSGVTVAMLGGLIGLHWSLGASSLTLVASTILVMVYAVRASAKRARAVPSELAR